MNIYYHKTGIDQNDIEFYSELFESNFYIKNATKNGRPSF